jgi:peptidyl-prolyl cis-trans isomerase B (cyclophilin B)
VSRSVGKPGPKPAKMKVTATLTTTVGGITFSMDGTKAPCTVNAFTYLASKGYFNNTKCHRLTTSGIYVLQCGDPSATGSGGPGFSYADENLTGLGTAAGAQAVYPAGTVAMANSGPNTNGSQFFLVYKDSPLAASYTPFGTITSGLNLVQKVGADGVAGGGGDGAPKDPVTIKTFVVS